MNIQPSKFYSDSAFWMQIIYSILASLLLWVGWYIKHLIDKQKDKKIIKAKLEYLASLRAVANVYSSMSIINDYKEVTRVLLLEISNGGNRPKPGSVVYARVVEAKITTNEVKSFSKLKILKAYENLRVDESYIKMILLAQNTNEPYKFDVANHSDCMLKDIYLTEGIKYSEINHVHTDPVAEKMFIVSIATNIEGQKFENNILRAKINLEIAQLVVNFNIYRTQ